MTLRFARGGVLLLKEGPCCFRACSVRERGIESLLTVTKASVTTWKFSSDRAVPGRCLPSRSEKKLLAWVPVEPVTAAVLNREMTTTGLARSSVENDGHEDRKSYSGVPRWNGCVRASTEQKLENLQAKINQKSSKTYMFHEVGLVKKHQSLPIVRAGAVVVEDFKSASGKGDGGNIHALLARMPRRMGTIARFSTKHGHRRHMDKRAKTQAHSRWKTGILTAEKVKPIDDELDNVDWRKLTTWQKWKHLKERVKQLYQRYFWVAMGTYVTLYVGGFGVIYGVLYSELVVPSVTASGGIQSLLDFTGLDHFEFVATNAKKLQSLADNNANIEKVVVAFFGNEFVEPARDVIVLLSTPTIARALGKAPSKRPIT